MASSKWVHPGKRITLSAGDTRITCAGGGGTIANGCAMVDCGRCPAAAAAAGVATTVTLRVHEAGDKGFSLFLSPRPALDGRTDLRAAGMYGVDSDGVRCIVDGVKREFGPAAEMVDGSLVAITFGACGFAVSVNGGAKTVLAAEFPACDMYAGAFLGPGASISLVSVDSSEGPAAVVKHAAAEIKETPTTPEWLVQAIRDMHISDAAVGGYASALFAAGVERPEFFSSEFVTHDVLEACITPAVHRNIIARSIGISSDAAVAAAAAAAAAAKERDDLQMQNALLRGAVFAAEGARLAARGVAQLGRIDDSLGGIEDRLRADERTADDGDGRMK